MNICTLKLVLALGFFEDAVDPKKKIIIRAYDEEERSSKGSILLPISVGPIVKDVPCKALDMELAYNILLGCPWIHSIQAIASTFHQCLKYPHNRCEITIRGDPNPFQYCNTIMPSTDLLFPFNRAI